MSDNLRTPDELGELLQGYCGKSVRVVVTRNRSTFLSCYPPTNGTEPLTMRVHACFLSAPEEVLRAVAMYASRPSRQDTAILRDYAEKAMEPSVPNGTPRPMPRLRSRGTHHDLHRLLSEVVALYFCGENVADVRITYGREGASQSRRRRSIHYGVFHYGTRTISIHPALDAPDVPEYFVSFVIFHELIHAVLPKPEVVGGRRRIHDREFRIREQSHPDYQRATAFSQEFLRRSR